MTATTDEGKLTAWERWELADFDGPGRKAGPKTAKDAAADAGVALPTAEDVERIFQQARTSGHETGYKEGYKEGQARAKDESGRIGRAATKLDGALSALESGVADELLKLAIELARQVVRREIAARPEMLLDVVREALAQLPHQHAAIYLNPDDASLVRSYLGDQLAHAGHRVHEDIKLARGDCVLEAGGSHLDASVATRWRRVLESLGLDDAWTPPAA